VAFIVAALSIVFFVYQFCCGTIVYPRRPQTKTKESNVRKIVKMVDPSTIEVTSAPLTSIRIRIRIGTNRPVNNPVNLPRAKQIQKVVLISEPLSPEKLSFTESWLYFLQ
jgi:hypothetical protein